MSNVPDIPAIKARYDATEQGDWFLKKVGSDALGWHYSICCADTDSIVASEANVAFMANAHQDIPALMERIKQLEDDRAMLGGVVGKFKKALQYVGLENHQSTCSGIRGGTCGCHVQIAADALRGR